MVLASNDLVVMVIDLCGSCWLFCYCRYWLLLPLPPVVDCCCCLLQFGPCRAMRLLILLVGWFLQLPLLVGSCFLSLRSLAIAVVAVVGDCCHCYHCCRGGRPVWLRLSLLLSLRPLFLAVIAVSITIIGWLFWSLLSLWSLVAIALLILRRSLPSFWFYIAAVVVHQSNNRWLSPAFVRSFVHFLAPCSFIDSLHVEYRVCCGVCSHGSFVYPYDVGRVFPVEVLWLGIFVFVVTFGDDWKFSMPVFQKITYEHKYIIII